MAETGNKYDFCGMKKVRKSNFSPEEIEALITTVGKNYEILYGEFAKRAVNKQARHKVWCDVTRQVNRVSLERRTLQEVKNKWKKCQHLCKERELSDDIVLPNVWEPLTSLKDKMKNKTKHRGNKANKRITMRQCTSYEPDFKKAVVLYAEQKSTSEAKRRYGISESNIRRWRRLKNDIIEKASQRKPTRKSTRAVNTFESSLEECDSLDFSSSLDSMPLEQRLKAPPEEPILQSQPLSPTKLKVTRQSTKLPQPSPKPAAPEPPNEEVCLRWNSHHSNMQSSFPSLLLREQYVDATLVAEGQCLKCHRLILSSCSPYFEEVLSGISPFQHPVLFMKDIPFWVLKSLCDFMYAGEVHIFQNKLEELLAVAETLKIKGLAGKTDGCNEEVKTAETAKAVKDEKKEEKEVKEVKEKKRNSQQSETTPKTNTKNLRSLHPSKKSEKTSKESLNKEGILDPLDLLEPVYEEVTKETAPPKVKEVKSVPVKKGKLKKRKFSEEREESPPPLFLSRKGTRSRPNVKIPKYYHTHYERVSESTIVREPHTQQPDPLFQVEEIKSELLDVEDDVIEIEDNVIDFSEVPEIPPHDEEIVWNYDIPMVDSNEKDKEEAPSLFKKINLIAQPIVMNVHSSDEKRPNTLQIVDVAQLKGAVEKNEDPLEVIPSQQDGKVVDDPLNFVNEVLEEGADSITITNVQSMAGMEDTEEMQEKIVGDAEKEQQVGTGEEEKVVDDIRSEFHIGNVVDERDSAVVAEKVVESVSTAENDVTEAEKSEISVENEKNIESISNVEVLHEKETSDRGESQKTSQDTGITSEEDKQSQSELEKQVTVNNAEEEPEENPVELGFHIAKVASEQFTLINEAPNDVKDVISEDCASELGFQITNVVSGQIEDSDQTTSLTNDVGSFTNHLDGTGAGFPEEMGSLGDVKSAAPSAEQSLSQETEFLADSLEKLLDE